MGAALLPGYLFTFSLQDYIGIIIVFNGAFFWWLALFEGPVDLGWWRKMDPFWGIRLLWKKMQLHTGPPFSLLLLFPSLFSSRCQSLGTVCITAAIVKQTQQGFSLAISLEKYRNAKSLDIKPDVMWQSGWWFLTWTFKSSFIVKGMDARLTHTSCVVFWGVFTCTADFFPPSRKKAIWKRCGSSDDKDDDNNVESKCYPETSSYNPARESAEVQTGYCKTPHYIS